MVLLLALSMGPLLTSAARSDTEVDLALVLAVDVSRSMDTDEQRLQRDGFVEAFRSQVVHDAIRKGVIGRIAAPTWSGLVQRSRRSLCPGQFSMAPKGLEVFPTRSRAHP